MNREEVRDLINDISGQNVFTEYHVSGHDLTIKCSHGTLTAEQESVIWGNKWDIIEYLTCPPDQKGTCNRCKRERTWYCSLYGDWLCACPSLNREADEILPKVTKPKYADYWTRNTN